ncbi:MAG: hypothetical protein IKW76_11225 [Clostridia bacterium]|nr:hypothetical protein [Clostridia bacterium]
MNRRILISFLLLLIAAVLSLTSFLVLQNRFSALGEALENAIYADMPVRESCRQIAHAWDRCRSPAQMFLLHSDLTELRTSVESLSDLTAEPAAFRASCIRSLHLLAGIRDSLPPTVGNIL